jgi:hypothetical protein
LITLQGKSNPEMKVGAEGLRHGEEPYPAPLMYVLENFRPQGYLDYNLPDIVVKYPYRNHSLGFCIFRGRSPASHRGAGAHPL